MARMARQLGTLVLLALVWPGFARAQAPLATRAVPRRTVLRLPQSVAPTSEDESISTPAPDTEEPQILQSLPDVPSEPSSLFAPAPPTGGPAPNFERPYFRRDPLLDPADWPQPGWFADVDLGAIKPHVSYTSNVVPTLLGLGVTSSALGPTVQIGSAHLNWAVAPRVEIGYRLPSGFGEISVSDRFFNTGGSDTILVADGPAARASTFFLNYTDIDYGSREFTPWDNWSLKFRGGLRFAQTSFSTRLGESFAEAAAGSTIVSQTQSNRGQGGGSHFGVELDRRFPGRGLTLVTQADASDLFMRTRQTAGLTTTTLIPGFGFDSGSISKTFIQQNPILTVQIGLSYQPQRWRNSRLYVGYFGQFWYVFATDTTNSPPQAPSHFDNQGAILQWSWNH